MGEDRSLDEFFTVSDDGDGADDERDTSDGDAVAEVDDADASDAGAGGAEPGDTPPNDTEIDDTEIDDTADQPRATYRWTPDGDDCPVCGTRVEAQWRDGDQFVCADCKEW